MKATLLGALAVLFLSGSLAGDELETLIQEYRKVKAQAGRRGPGPGGGPPGQGPGGPGGFGPGGGRDASDRAERILDEIGRLGTDLALKFLLEELESAPASLASLCARAALKSGHPRCPAVVFQLLRTKPPKVSIAILDAVNPEEEPSAGPWPGARQRRAPRTGVPVDWTKIEEELLGASRTVKDIEVKRRLVPVVAKLPGISAAKGVVQTAATQRKHGPDEELHLRAVEALVTVAKNNVEVRTWFETDALAFASSNPGMLAAVTEAVGRLGIAELRPRVEELLSHRAEEVVMAAIEALNRLPGQLSESNVKAVSRHLKRAKSVTDRARILDGLARDGSPHAIEVVLESAKKGDVASRAIATRSLGLATENPEAVEALLAALEDKAFEVRSNALLALRKARSKAVVPALIDHLERETVDRLKADALRILVDLTGHNMGFVTADWKQWWEVAEKDFTLVQPEKGSSKTVVTSSYFGIEVTSKRLAFLVDVSRSMESSRGFFPGAQRQPQGKSKLDLLKEELTRLLKEMSDDTQVNIITFDGTVRNWSEKLQPLAKGGRERAIDFVKGLRTGLHTNVFDSLERGLNDTRVDTIYLLTDGQPTTGRFTDTPGILNGVRELNRVRGVTIHCIAFGEESELLRALADENGGVYRFIQPEGQAPQGGAGGSP